MGENQNADCWNWLVEDRFVLVMVQRQAVRPWEAEEKSVHETDMKYLWEGHLVCLSEPYIFNTYYHEMS